MYILRITLKSIKKNNKFKQNLLKIKNLNNIQNIKIKGIFNIKNKNNIFTLLKSPHVNKKSREHFIYKNYSHKIDIKSINLYQLLNIFIIIKKTLIENFIIKAKIIKN